MALVGASQGILLYIILGPSYLSDYCPEYHLTMTENQRQYILRRIERDATELQNGISSRRPNSVSHVLDNSNYITKSENNWMCNSCIYKRQCDGYHERYQLGVFPNDVDIIKDLAKQIKLLTKTGNLYL